MGDNRQAKQVIVMLRKPGMPRGKEIAQGAHAAMAWLTNRMNPDRHFPRRFCAALTEAEIAWVNGSFTKITCQVPTLDELLQVAELAKEHDVQCYVITDAGRTVFRGEPTITCLAVGPDWEDLVDPITGHLKLY